MLFPFQEPLKHLLWTYHLPWWHLLPLEQSLWKWCRFLGLVHGDAESCKRTISKPHLIKQISFKTRQAFCMQAYIYMLYKQSVIIGCARQIQCKLVQLINQGMDNSIHFPLTSWYWWSLLVASPAAPTPPTHPLLALPGSGDSLTAICKCLQIDSLL